MCLSPRFVVPAMLQILGSSARLCDGIPRRSFLQIGALGLGGLTLGSLMRAEAASGKKNHKSVIMVYLSGGLAHQDTFDPKPNAPAEVRGEFKPIATKLPGVQFSEMLPMTWPIFIPPPARIAPLTRAQ